MSDEASQHFQQDEMKESTTGGRSYTLTITLHPNGQLDLSGPLGNRVLSYGLLGAAASKLDELWAMKALEQYAEKMAASRGGINGLLKRMNGG